jgi:hypothetical protein
MKRFTLFLALILSIAVWSLTGCKKEDKPVLSNSYSGTLYYEYSKGFPEFKTVSTLDVSLDKNGVFTSGSYQSASFDNEAVKYNGTKPEMKMHMTGTVTVDGAQGNYSKIDGVDKLLILIHSVIQGNMKIYGWDNDLGWILLTDQDFTYTDEFSDGTWEFSLDEAVLSGSTITTTLPDIEGTSTYGYTLFLIAPL